MRKLAIILVALGLLAGCEEQAEYGPKGEKVVKSLPRYEWSTGNVASVRDNETGEEWLVWFAYGTSSITSQLLRHTGGEP